MTFALSRLLVLAALSRQAPVAPPRVLTPRPACDSALLTQAEGAQEPNRPTGLDLRGQDGARLRYVGVHHTFDSADAQVGQLTAVWDSLRPTVALYEGLSTDVGSTAAQSVARFGEPGLIRYLGLRDGVPTESLEPSREDEAAGLLHTFTAEQLVLFYVARPLTEARERRGLSRASLDSLLPEVLDAIQRVPPLAGALPDTAAYRTAFARWFPNLAPTAVPTNWFDPRRTSSETGSRFFNDVNAASSAFRDLFMYHRVAAAWHPGVRIFAAVGRDHIPAQAPALRCALAP